MIDEQRERVGHGYDHVRGRREIGWDRVKENTTCYILNHFSLEKECDD